MQLCLSFPFRVGGGRRCEDDRTGPLLFPLCPIREKDRGRCRALRPGRGGWGFFSGRMGRRGDWRGILEPDEPGCPADRPWSGKEAAKRRGPVRNEYRRSVPRISPETDQGKKDRLCRSRRFYSSYPLQQFHVDGLHPPRRGGVLSLFLCRPDHLTRQNKINGLPLPCSLFHRKSGLSHQFSGMMKSSSFSRPNAAPAEESMSFS